MYCKLPTDKWSFCSSSIKAAIEEVLFKLFWSWPKAIGLKYTQLPLPWRLCSLCVCTSSCFLLWNTSGKVWKVKGGAVSGFRLNISGVFFGSPSCFMSLVGSTQLMCWGHFLPRVHWTCVCDRPIFVGPVTRIFVFIGCQPGSGHLVAL